MAVPVLLLSYSGAEQEVVFVIEALSCLRQLNVPSVILRLTLAMFFGGMIGLERARKGRPAGFRTYMLVCLGAALTMLLSQYEYYMLNHNWAALAAEVGIRTDVSRFGAQVINGIGFLGAGTIIVTGRQEVKGLTTAAGLWASACMGLAIGAGFYECVAMAFLMIFLSVHVLTPLELLVIENARNMNIYVEFQSLDNVGEIINRIKTQGAQIYEAEVDHGRESPSHHPNAIFTIRMNQKGGHAKLLALISEMESVYVVHDI
jgi:putative Mg2+ transporter-C (MgtC) family protein